MRNQFGEKLFSIFFKTYTEKVWGMSCDEISADWAAQRIKGLDLGVAVHGRAEEGARCRHASRRRDGPVVKTLIESFRYPRQGPGMMWEAAARKIQKRGGKVLMGRELQQLSYDHAARLWTHRGRDCADGSTETYTARHVDLVRRRCANWSRRSRPTPISRLHARELRYRDFLTVALMVEEARPVPRQLDLHPRSVGEGRPRAEFPLVVAGDGASPA